MTSGLVTYGMPIVGEPSDAETLEALSQRYRSTSVEPDPVKWAKDSMNVDTYSKQRLILRYLETCPRVAVPSCHDAGKSFTAALAAARFLAKHVPGTARVVSTAPTMTQVRAILWNEINSLHSKAKKEDGTPLLPGRVNQTEWWIGGYMAGIGRKPSDYAPETFSGLHAEYILIILDEAGDVPPDLWTGVDTLATNEGAVILAIGNPNDPLAEFKNVVEGAPENGWVVVKIPATETPNFTGEKCAPIFKRVLITVDWANRQKAKWGEDSGLYAAKVLAEFPDSAAMTILRITDVEWARNYERPAEDKNVLKMERVVLGVDIAASEEGDETVVRECRGDRVGRRWATRSSEPEDIADLIVHAAVEAGATMLHVDATGVGFGFLSELRKRLPNCAVLPFLAAAQATNPKEFHNRRAEAHWVLRDKLRRHELDLSDMEESSEDDALDTMAQLLGVRYSVKKGRILVEDKKAVRKRIGRSPDDGDALLLAVCPPNTGGVPQPAHARAASGRRRREEAAQVAEQKILATARSTPQAVPETVVSSTEDSLLRPRRRRLRAHVG